MADLQIQNPSITTNVFEYDEAGRVSAISGHPLAGEGGGEVVKSDLMWKPTVGADGYVRWTLASSATEPDAAYISGAQGPAGTNGTNGKDGTNGYSVELQSVTDEDGGKKVTLSWGATPSTSSFVIPSGAKGADGQNGQNGAPGADGISPTFTTSVTSDAQHQQGGTHVVISGAAGESAFNVWNGVDGEGATVDLLEGNGIQITHEAGTTKYTIGVSADYMTTVSADSTLSGDGTSGHPLGIDMSSAYSIDGTHGITAIPNTADKKVIVQMTDDVWAYYQRLAASANVWDSASAIGNKSKTVINNSVNTITTENSGTSATLSAVEYKVNTSFQNAAPKQLFVVQDDNDIYAKLSEVNGKGSLFFVCSAI